MQTHSKNNLNIKKFWEKSVCYFNLFTFLWLFGGGQILLFASRTQGLWFDGFYGFFTGAVIVLAILSIVFFGKTLPLTTTNILLFLAFLIVLLTPVLLSEKIQATDQNALRRFLLFLPFVVMPSLWGIVFRKDMLNENKLIFLCCIFLAIGNLLLFRYYLETALSLFRAGDVSNAIGLSYAFANLWILVLAWSLLRRKTLLFSLASIVALINVFLLSTRQSIVYITFVVLLLCFFWMLPFSIRKKPAISISFSMRKTRLLALTLFSLVIILIALQPVGWALGKQDIIKNAFETASLRWTGFFQAGYTDEVRVQLFKEATEVWREKPILGEFHYHDTPGSYAHHMLVDLLAQYGLLGCTVYLALIFVALKNIIKTGKDNLLDVSFAFMFTALLFIGMTVTQFTIDPIFHFLLFYWVANKQVSKEGPSY